MKFNTLEKILSGVAVALIAGSFALAETEYKKLSRAIYIGAVASTISLVVARYSRIRKLEEEYGASDR